MRWGGPSSGTPRGALHHPGKSLSVSPCQVVQTPSVSPFASQDRLQAPRCCCHVLCWFARVGRALPVLPALPARGPAHAIRAPPDQGGLCGLRSMLETDQGDYTTAVR